MARLSAIVTSSTKAPDRSAPASVGAVTTWWPVTSFTAKIANVTISTTVMTACTRWITS